MKKTTFFLIVNLFFLGAISQDFKGDFQLLCNEGSEEEITTLLQNWEKAEPENPEMFIAKEILNVMDIGESHNHAWLWTDNEEVPDAKVFFIDNIQGYMNGWFYGDEIPIEAIKRISEKATQYYPERIEFFTNLGAMYSLEEEYEKAIDYFMAASKLDETDMIVLANLANVYSKWGRPKKAIHYYRQMIKLGDPEDIKYAEDQIKVLKE